MNDFQYKESTEENTKTKMTKGQNRKYGKVQEFK